MFMDHETIPFNLVFNFCIQTLPEKVGTTELDAWQFLIYSYGVQFFLVNKLVYFNRTEITISRCYVMTSKFQLYLIPRIQKIKTSFFSYSDFPNGLVSKDTCMFVKCDYAASSGLSTVQPLLSLPFYSPLAFLPMGIYRRAKKAHILVLVFTSQRFCLNF